MIEDNTKYWDDLEEMFATNGWRQLILELKAEIYQSQADALEAPTWDDVNRFKGRANALAYIANLEQIVSLQRKQKQSEEADDLVAEEA